MIAQEQQIWINQGCAELRSFIKNHPRDFKIIFEKQYYPAALEIAKRMAAANQVILHPQVIKEKTPKQQLTIVAKWLMMRVNPKKI